jgi:hypothetical protein
MQRMQTRFSSGPVFGSSRIAVVAVLMVGLVGCSRSVPMGPAPNLELAEELREALGGGMVADAGDEDAASTGTGWATLRGRFVFDGTPPQRKPLVINKNLDVCAPGGVPVLSQSLLVDDSSKGIANVAIFLRKAPRVHESAQPNEDTVLFDQEKCIFLTHVLSLTVGQTLELKNSDPVGHNTNVENLTNMVIPAGQSMTQVIKKESQDPLKVVCNIHPWMVAYILPLKDGYVAISAVDGTFEIANLPAGVELEFQAWHESGAGSKGKLFVDTAEAKALKWSSKGRFKVTLVADQEMDLGEIVVPATAFHGG